MFKGDHERNGRDHKLLLLMAMGLFAALLVAAFVPSQAYYRIGATAGLGGLLIWIVRHARQLARERLGAELLAALAQRDRVAFDELVRRASEALGDQPAGANSATLAPVADVGVGQSPPASDDQPPAGRREE